MNPRSSRTDSDKRHDRHQEMSSTTKSGSVHGDWYLQGRFSIFRKPVILISSRVLVPSTATTKKEKSATILVIGWEFQLFFKQKLWGKKNHIFKYFFYRLGWTKQKSFFLFHSLYSMYFYIYLLIFFKYLLLLYSFSSLLLSLYLQSFVFNVFCY